MVPVGDFLKHRSISLGELLHFSSQIYHPKKDPKASSYMNMSMFFFEFSGFDARFFLIHPDHRIFYLLQDTVGSSESGVCPCDSQKIQRVISSFSAKAP